MFCTLRGIAAVVLWMSENTVLGESSDFIKTGEILPNTQQFVKTVCTVVGVAVGEVIGIAVFPGPEEAHQRHNGFAGSQ